MELHAVKTFYTARDGLVSLEDDVLSVVRQVRELYGDRIKVCMEQTTGEYVFSENCADGTERLIFTTTELDGRALLRLQQADSQSRGYEDAYDRQEHEQDEEFERRQKESLEKLAPAAEELAWSLGDGKFGPGYRQSISVPRDLDG